MIGTGLLRKVAREMNQVMGLKPPIDINTTRNWKDLFTEIEKNAKGIDDYGNIDPDEGLNTQIDKGRFTEETEDFLGEHKLLPKDWKWVPKTKPRPAPKGGTVWNPRPRSATGFVYELVGKGVGDKFIEKDLVRKFGYDRVGAEEYVKHFWAHMRRLYHRKRLEKPYMELMEKRLGVEPQKGI